MSPFKEGKASERYSPVASRKEQLIAVARGGEQKARPGNELRTLPANSQ